jgi:hypothetical protein
MAATLIQAAATTGSLINMQTDSVRLNVSNNSNDS